MNGQINKQKIAVIGATGQVGTPLTRALLDMDHEVLAIGRKPHENLDEYRTRGAEIAVLDNLENEQALAEAIRGCDTLVCAVPANIDTVTKSEPIWLKAALKAGIKRFVPTEFGCHTVNLDYGVGILFDYKKDFHKKLFASGMGWTFIYNGIIYDYCLPNLRFFEKITTFGDIDLPIYTHRVDDIGRFAALALSDERTLNRCVQMDFQKLSQKEMIKLLKAGFPDVDFEYQHYSSEFIIDAMNSADDSVSAKKGAETDKERWGINNAVYVEGKLASFAKGTLRASELYPDFKLSQSAEEALSDKNFVFESREE